MRRPARKQLPSKPQSAPAAPEQPAVYQGLTYQRERLARIARELPPLFKKHHAELAVDPVRAPLDVDWDRYFDLDLVAALQIITVRDGAVLVGYVFNIISQHLHKKSTRWCTVDMYWLDPGYRVGLIGYRLFVENEKFLKLAGVQKVVVGEKLHFHNDHERKVNVLFKRLGYVPEDLYYGKWIGA